VPLAVEKQLGEARVPAPGVAVERHAQRLEPCTPRARPRRGWRVAGERPALAAQPRLGRAAHESRGSSVEGRRGPGRSAAGRGMATARGACAGSAELSGAACPCVHLKASRRAHCAKSSALPQHTVTRGRALDGIWGAGLGMRFLIRGGVGGDSTHCSQCDVRADARACVAPGFFRALLPASGPRDAMPCLPTCTSTLLPSPALFTLPPERSARGCTCRARIAASATPRETASGDCDAAWDGSRAERPRCPPRKMRGAAMSSNPRLEHNLRHRPRGAPPQRAPW
jgi:hypothetical protein